MLTWRDYVFFSSLFFFFFKCRARGPPSSRRQGRLASGSVAYLGRVYTPRTPPLQPENKPPFPPPTLPSPPTQPASRQTGEKPDSRWQHGLVSLGGRQPHTDFFSLPRFAWRKGPCIAQEQEQEQGSPTSSSFAFAAAASLPPSLPRTPAVGSDALKSLSSLRCVSPPTPPSRRRSSNGGKQGEQGKQPREGWKKNNKKNTLRESEVRAPGRTVRGRIRIYHLNLPSDLIGWGLCIPWRGPIRFYVSHSGY